MNKLLPKYKVNFILFQLIAFTFVCVLVFVDYFISYDFQYVKMGIKIFTILAIVIYETIICLSYRKSNKNQMRKTDFKEDGYNEKFLWLEILLLFDMLIIVALISQITKSNVNISIPLVLGFIIYYFISLFLIPYFGIKNKK